MNSELITDSIVADIRALLLRHRSTIANTINTAMLQSYWEIGRRIVEEEQSYLSRAEYGTQLIKKLSVELTSEFGRGFSERSLRNYRQFFLKFPDWTIWQPRLPNLTWSHISILLRVDDAEAREWYMKESQQQMWSKRMLDRNVSSQYYYRLLSSQKIRQDTDDRVMPLVKVSDDIPNPTDYIKSPMVTEFLGLPTDYSYSESDLEQSLISHLQQFLMELGKGYAFVERQQRIVTDTEVYYIDLVFYNYLMKCFVLIDLKTTKLTHQDVGQMDMYVRMYDELKRTEGDNPTIGILLCAETSQDIAKYSILNGSKQLFASKYLTYLPTEKQLREEIERQKMIFMLQQRSK